MVAQFAEHYFSALMRHVFLILEPESSVCSYDILQAIPCKKVL